MAVGCLHHPAPQRSCIQLCNIGLCVHLQGWGENDRGVSYTFGPDSVTEFLQKHDLDLVCRAHQVGGSGGGGGSSGGCVGGH